MPPVERDGGRGRLDRERDGGPGHYGRPVPTAEPYVDPTDYDDAYDDVAEGGPPDRAPAHDHRPPHDDAAANDAANGNVDVAATARESLGAELRRRLDTPLERDRGGDRPRGARDRAVAALADGAGAIRRAARAGPQGGCGEPTFDGERGLRLAALLEEGRERKAGGAKPRGELPAVLYKISSLADGQVSIIFHIPHDHAVAAMALLEHRDVPLGLSVRVIVADE
jgi:hypothetical protein